MLQQAEATNFDNVWVLSNDGALLHRTGRFEQAHACCQCVIVIVPNGDKLGQSKRASAAGYENLTAAELAQDSMDNLPVGVVTVQ